MKKLLLLGARKFIDMPVGTMYIRYWMNSTDECLHIIDIFKDNPLSPINLLDFKNMEIYGDNDSSLSFENPDENEGYWMNWYDANVVGDADPFNTLYLILDESWIPESTKYTEDRDKSYIENNTIGIIPGLILTREQVIDAKKEFMSYFISDDNIHNPANTRARMTLDEYIRENKENAKIMNTYIEYIHEE